MVLKPAVFRRIVARAVAVAERRDTVVTSGIRPTYPATGYGYVDPSRGTFVEKPTCTFVQVLNCKQKTSEGLS